MSQQESKDRCRELMRALRHLHTASAHLFLLWAQCDVTHDDYESLGACVQALDRAIMQLHVQGLGSPNIINPIVVRDALKRVLNRVFECVPSHERTLVQAEVVEAFHICYPDERLPIYQISLQGRSSRD